MDLRGEVLGDGGEGGIGPGIGGAVPADEPVGNVDVVGAVLVGAVLLEKVGHLDVKVREFGCFLAPGVVAVNVRKGGDGTALEDVEPGVELGFAASVVMPNLPYVSAACVSRHRQARTTPLHITRTAYQR